MGKNGSNTMPVANTKEVAGSPLPPWIMMMREAAMKAISISDVADIVKDQVARAKKGDQNAIRFVFDQVLGGAQLKVATFIQNNYTAETIAAATGKPTPVMPGTPDKVEVMRMRVAAGAEVFNANDGPEVDLT
jgi:hypothetical protein